MLVSVRIHLHFNLKFLKAGPHTVPVSLGNVFTFHDLCIITQREGVGG